MLRQEKSGHTLQPTALVNEAYLKLRDRVGLEDRGPVPFKALAARTMVQVLVDHARRRGALRRSGGERRRVSLAEAAEILKVPEADFSHINEAMQRLAALDSRKADVVELRFFGGLTNPEVADVLGVSRSTVESDWRVARAWLRGELCRRNQQ